MRRAAVLSSALLVTLVAPTVAPAAEWVVRPGGAPLSEILAQVADGDVVKVEGGVHAGPLTLERSIRLTGVDWPILDGGGRGTVLSIAAPAVTLEGFEIRGSGDSLDQEDAGLELEGAGGVVRGNRFDDVLFGIYLRQAPETRIEGNRIRGKALDLARRGDAMRVWYSDSVRIFDNDVEGSRDIVLWYSNDLEIAGNRVREGRYGLHFMYCDDASIVDNLLFENSVGAFLMYSRRLKLEGNSVAGNHGPSGYGFGLKDMDDAVIRGNRLVGNRVGVFLDNSPRESGSTTRVGGNVLSGNDVGVLLMPNVRRAEFSGNDLVENELQVEIAGGGGDAQANDWRHNYWSDYAGVDVDDDGLGELPYRADRMIEEVIHRHPEFRLFRGSPAAAALDFAANAFPVVRPRPKLVDTSPRVRPLRLAGLPPLPTPADQGGWGLIGLGLLALSASILIAPHARRRRREETSAQRAVASEDGIVILARDLGKRFGDRHALADVALQIAAGESVALWGANGAGKTTALHAMLGVLRYTGEVRILGHCPLADGRAVRRSIGFVPQEASLEGDARVRETVDFFARLRGAAPQGVDELLAWLELDDESEARVEELSGGQRQRLALGIALLGDPPILFLDEPTANLDASARGALYERLELLRGRGKTVVFTSHRADEVRLLADRVLVLERGRLTANLPVAEFEPAAARATDSGVAPVPPRRAGTSARNETLDRQPAEASAEGGAAGA